MNRAEKRRQKKLAKKQTMARAKPAQPSLNIEQTLQLGVQAHSNGRLPEAENLYQQVLRAEPRQPVALQLLGVIALQGGDNEGAAQLISKAIAIMPQYADAHNNLGNALKNMGKLDDALNSYHKAIAIKPDYADAHANLGNVLGDLGKLDEAVGSYQKAIAINPHSSDAHYNLGNAFQAQGKLDDALASYNTSLSINPNNAQAHYNLGLAHRNMGNLNKAISSLKNAIAINPDYFEAHNNLGICHHDLGQLDAALGNYKKALSIKPDAAEFHCNVGAVLADLQNFSAAEQSFLKAIAIKPDYAEAYNYLGITLRNLRRLDEAVDNYRQAIAYKADYDEAHSNLIFIQDLIPAIDQAEQQLERQRWDRAFIGPIKNRTGPHNNDRDPARPLRIGYVSADFRRHSACLGFGPLIMNYDSQNFEVTCYDASPASDDISDALRATATHWRKINSLSDEKLAATIVEDAIDILVDLSGHTRGNRLKAFGHKPAPLQVSGIGHLAPGLSCIDYRLTTAQLTPPEEADIYPEQAVYLQTYFGFTPPPGPPPVGPAPCLENGFVTFGFLGRFSKTTDQLMTLWASILGAVPNSRLLLKYAELDAAEECQRVRRIFSSSGIGEDSLTLLGSSDQHQHLSAHNSVDIVFDSIPHGGGITTLESLWMGVPVVGLTDINKAGGRMIASICAPLGLADWATHSPEQYHDHALKWATRPDELAQIRARLRAQVFDVYARFPRDVENSYRLMWRRWCAGETPAPLHP